MVELYWPRSTTFLGPKNRYTGPGLHDVPDELEDGFRARGWEDPPDESDDSEDSEDSEDENSDNSEGEDELDDRAIELADGGYQNAVDTIESGEADEFLGDLGEVDDRATVQEAIDDRREELE